MVNENLLEYYYGSPDHVYNIHNNELSRRKFELNFRQDDAIAFGYYPIDLDGNYELMSGSGMIHYEISEKKAAPKLLGKALAHVGRGFFSVVKACYLKAYAKGRYWPKENIISFWSQPTSDIVSDVVEKLGIDPYECIMITKKEISRKDYETPDMTVAEYINLGYGKGRRKGKGDDGSDKREEGLVLPDKVINVIKRFNSQSEEDSFAIRKEREGWPFMAKRNSMIYQENKASGKPLNEYFTGDPDTIKDVNPDNEELTKKYVFNRSKTISFGFFQTSYDGTKEFISAYNDGHWDIAAKAKDKLVGKALNSDQITPYQMAGITTAVYRTAAYKGRIFLEPKVVVFWHDLSSKKVGEILSMIKGIDDWEGYTYLNSADDLAYDLTEFLQKGYGGDSSDIELNEERMQKNALELIDEDLANFIRRSNEPQTTSLDAQLSKPTKSHPHGMTRAEYNSIIHPFESKEPKKTIKEYIMNSKINNKEFANYMLIMSEALDKGDYKAYEYVRNILDEAIEERKHEDELLKEMNTTNFGILNHIFEQELPTLFKTNKKAVKEVIKTIKEDKNLLSQFNFYNVVKEQYKGSKIEERMVLERLTKIVCEDIDFNTVKDSNKKLRKVMKENGVIPSDFVDDESRSLYESGNVILTKKQTVANTLPLIESYDAVCKYMERHKNDSTSNRVDVNKLVKEFEEKLKTNLNESEMSFVKEITDFKSPMAEKRKEKLFNKFKNECIDKINKMLSEDSSNSELLSLKAQIEEQKFNNETIVKDIAKLLEIRDILMDD